MESPVRLANGCHEDRRDTVAQREHRRSARRLCGTTKEGHVRRREVEHALIGEKADPPSLFDGSRDASDSLRVVHHRHPEVSARPVEIAIEYRIRHAPHDHIQRDPTRRNVRTGELPIPEMTSDEQQPTPFGDRAFDELPTGRVRDEIENALSTEGGHERGFDGDTTEMIVRGTRHLCDAVRVPLRKCARNLAFHHIASYT